MTWVDAIPAVTGVLYAGAAIGYGSRGQVALGIAYAGYALAAGALAVVGLRG